MVWSLIFKDEEAKKWFEEKYSFCRLMHDHYIEEEGYERCDFIYDAGYCGYIEAEEMLEEVKKNGIIEFKELHLCDTEDFRCVNDLKSEEKK